MKKVISQILTVLVLGISISAQSEKPILHDEFGPLALSDLSSRLDSFRNEFRSKENSLALIRIYGGTGNGIFFPYSRKAFFEGYFSNFDFNDKSKLTIQVCSSDESEIRHQFFIVLPDAEIDECESVLKIPQQTQLIRTDYLYPVGASETNDDYLGTKGVDKAVDEAAKTFLAGLLNKSPDSRIYVIGYAGRYFKPTMDETENPVVSKTDSPNINNKLLKQIKNDFVKKGIDSSRIFTVKGGYSDGVKKIEFYFVPKNGEIPKPKPDDFSEKKGK